MKSLLAPFFLAALLLGSGCASVPTEPKSATAVVPVINPVRWETRVQRYLERDRANPPPIGGIVFCGSSSIDMWQSLAADFPGRAVVRRGIGGTWLADLPQFAPALVYPLRPRAVVVYAGENDLHAGRSVEEVVHAFRTVCEQIRAAAPGAPIVYLAIKPSPSRRALLDQMREANRRISEACAVDPTCTFVDVFTPMLNTAGEPRSELFSADMLHMNTDGYRLWTALVAPVLPRNE